jgi:hypothetical protein
MQQQQAASDVSDSEWESAEGSADGLQEEQDVSGQQQHPHAQQQQQQQTQQRQRRQAQAGPKLPPDEEALSLLVPSHRADPHSMKTLWKRESLMVCSLKWQAVLL